MSVSTTFAPIAGDATIRVEMFGITTNVPVSMVLSEPSDAPEMSVSAESSGMGDQFAMYDFDGILLSVGDRVVKSVMTQNGVACPKMSAMSDEYEIYGFVPFAYEAFEVSGLSEITELGDNGEMSVLDEMTEMFGMVSYVVLRSVETGTYEMVHSSEIAWIGHDPVFEAIFGA